MGSNQSHLVFKHSVQLPTENFTGTVWFYACLYSSLVQVPFGVPSSPSPHMPCSPIHQEASLVLLVCKSTQWIAMWNVTHFLSQKLHLKGAQYVFEISHTANPNTLSCDSPQYYKIRQALQLVRSKCSYLIHYDQDMEDKEFTWFSQNTTTEISVKII